jgi:hypothetical protein
MGKGESACILLPAAATPLKTFNLTHHAINEHDATCVRVIFQRVLEGWDYDAVIKELNAKRYLTKISLIGIEELIAAI